jgi:hypothetical protein
MNNLFKRSFLILFGLCLLAGFLAGSFTARATEAGEPLAFPGIPTPPGLATRQRNLLLIGVDRLHARHPRLESLWLAMVVPNSPGVTLMPLYPRMVDGVPQPDETLEVAFRLDDRLAPYTGFANVLRARELWWNHFVVLDEMRAIAELPKAQEDAHGALLSQTALLNGLCLSQSQLSNSEKPGELPERLSSHMISDLSPAQMSRDWQRIRAAGGRLCKFPIQREMGFNLARP